MKRFLKTIQGKTITFILCIVSACVLLGSILAAIFMVEYDFYTQDKEVVLDNVVIQEEIRNNLYSKIWTIANEYDKETIGFEKEGRVSFRVVNEKNEVLGETYDVTDADLDQWDYTLHYGILRDASGQIEDILLYSHLDPTVEQYTAYVNYDKNSVITDKYSFAKGFIERAYSLRYSIYGIIAVSCITMICTFVALMVVAGRRNEDDLLHPGPLHKIPFDLLFVAWAFGFVGMIVVFNPTIFSYGVAVLVLVGIFIFANLFLGLCMSFAVRVKDKSLVKGSFLYYLVVKCLQILRVIWNWLKNLLKGIISGLVQIPLVWKTALILVGICIYELIFFFMPYGITPWWILEKVILIPAVLYIALTLRALQKGGVALANGELSYHVDTGKMIADFKDHGENLNNIAKGMAIAVNDQLKSERMKTELITNVSHDIKTPLTSIINYSDLIEKEETDNEKIHEYSEVLHRQSERLKRLIDDLVEASKASTGNLEVNLMPCDSATFVNQAVGEYQDKLNEAGLTLVTSVPNEELSIMADGRRMWRIFDNLMNNIAKYAKEDTRVYLSLEKVDDQAVFTFKNTSREQLNISEEELMERFTRGDESRNTEGNGLGLSIAKSMAELQNGNLKVSIDGDLFKAILSFPLIG